MGRGKEEVSPGRAVKESEGDLPGAVVGKSVATEHNRIPHGLIRIIDRDLSANAPSLALLRSGGHLGEAG